MATDKKNTRQELVESIINSMKNRNGEWQKTWTNISSQTAPHNPLTGTKYKGVNLIALSLEQTKLNTQDSRWCTFDQAVEAGYKIPKNTKAAHAYFYDFKVSLGQEGKLHDIKAKNIHEYISKVITHYKEQYPDKITEINKSLYQANKLKPAMKSDKGKLALFVGELNKATGAHIKFNANTVIKTFPIFNYSQLENVPKLEIAPTTSTFEQIKRAEGILLASGAKIYHDSTNRNYYHPEKHEIHLTPKEAFKTNEAYYSTALHEVAHWTKGDGVVRHVKNDEKSGTGHELAYAREELRAELASVFMASDLNLKLDVQNHAAYLGSYLQILNNDYNEFFSAVSDAQKISTHVLGLEKRLNLDNAEAKELETKNPELYQKIVDFNAQSNDIYEYPGKAYVTYDFKVGDTFILTDEDNGIGKLQVDSMHDDRIILKDLTYNIIQDHNHQSLEEMLNAFYHTEKLDLTSPQLSIDESYRDIGKEVLKNEFYSSALQNRENTFVFDNARSAQKFIDTLTIKHDVPNNMIISSNFERNDKIQSLVFSREDNGDLAIAAQESPDKQYLQAFFDEKKTINAEFHAHNHGNKIAINRDVLVDYLVNHLDSGSQHQVRDTLVKLDFANADINPYMEQCAQAMIMQQEAEMAMVEDFHNESRQVFKDVENQHSDDIDYSNNDDNDFSR